jgi:DsbC/DsbD-like thiol-disulfide interchange protein
MKLNITTIQVLFLILFAASFYSLAQQKSLAEAKLVVDSYSPQIDSVISIGVLINLKDDWHIYWRNPGESGLPTKIDFILPEKFNVSEIKFPIPKIFHSDEIVNYGYSHQVLLISEINIPKDLKQKEILISAKLSSLICKDLCKAFDTTLTLKINLSHSFQADKKISDLFNKTKNLIPIENHKLNISATKISDSVLIKLDKNAIENLNAINFEFYPYQAGVFKNVAKQTNKDSENYLELVLEPDQYRIENPTEVKGIILFNNYHTKAYEINIPVKE